MGNARIQLRRGTAAFWASENPTLHQGEPGYETDTKKTKIGDGKTPWLELAYGDAGTGTMGPPGPRGPKGNTGDAGPIGPQGPAGADGVQGLQGPQGPKGDIGDAGPAGPAGPAGLQGPKGDKGDTGDAGPMGPKGDTGDIGGVGPQGPKGDTGADGAPGPQGPQGLQGPAGVAPARMGMSLVTKSLSANGREKSSGATNFYVANAYKITSNRPARVRFYTTTEKRDADASRAIGTDPTDDHGVLLDVVFTSSTLSLDLSPSAMLHNEESPRFKSLGYIVDNLDTNAGTVNINVDYQVIE